MPLFSRGFVRRRAISLATSLSVTATSFALAQAPTHRSRILTVSDVGERQFLFENDLAMSNMNRSLLTRPSGDIDRDFVDIMAPHHQGAIDMARTEMKYGHNDALRQLAERIVRQAEQDLACMRGTKPATAGSTRSSSTDLDLRAHN
ncbi:DUF305 domain-containing protein [Bradyrhizobium sp. 6(2017)]|uniref:DUF305 domain-containing protein n=1 Tax=Bradyrhizobium sp. 6(2017) TaxID=1197460 RepID=UPI0013E13991|nr:DUF305 domain-containing protein [Bradyrhizobium sp. 6(2017)]QIG98239.1 DUF305 domain-containing protein [Bradyrhizobium sp. 6(2017)]